MSVWPHPPGGNRGYGGVETRTDGHFGGHGDQDRLTGGDPPGFGKAPTLVRNPADPAAVSVPTRSLRVVIGPPPSAHVPGPRGGFRSDPTDATAELPRVDVRGDAPTTALPKVRDDGPGPDGPMRRTVGRASAPTGSTTRPAAKAVVAKAAAAKAAAPAAPAKRGPLQPGMFLLPLRLFLGVAFLLEGLRKLYDPAFLDPDAPDSFAHRIAVLQPGSFAPSVLDLASQHAITVGLLFAFGQVVAGVGALLGLWTRAMGMIGMLLSLGVLIAVGGSSSPYHGAYIVFLAAWSPLALAGAPMYSVDCWLSLRDWRGPLTLPVRARRRKLGYGSIIAGAGVGLTLLAGALFGHPTAPDTTVPAGTPETLVDGTTAPEAPSAPAPAVVAPPAAPSAAPAVPSAAPSGTRGAAGTPAAGTPSTAPKPSTATGRTPADATTPRKPSAPGASNPQAPASSSQAKPTSQKPAANTGSGSLGGSPIGGLLGG